MPHLTTRHCICHEIWSVVYEIVAVRSMKAYRGRWGKLHSFFTSTRPLYPRGKSILYPLNRLWVGLRAGLYVVGNAFLVGILNGLKLQHIRKVTASNGPFVRCGLRRTYQGWRTDVVCTWHGKGWVFVSFRSANRGVYCAVRAEYLTAVHASLNGHSRVFMCIAIPK